MEIPRTVDTMSQHAPDDGYPDASWETERLICTPGSPQKRSHSLTCAVRTHEPCDCESQGPHGDGDWPQGQQDAPTENNSKSLREMSSAVYGDEIRSESRTGSELLTAAEARDNVEALLVGTIHELSEQISATQEITGEYCYLCGAFTPKPLAPPVHDLSEQAANGSYHSTSTFMRTYPCGCLYGHPDQGWLPDYCPLHGPATEPHTQMPPSTHSPTKGIDSYQPPRPFVGPLDLPAPSVPSVPVSELMRALDEIDPYDASTYSYFVAEVYALIAKAQS